MAKSFFVSLHRLYNFAPKRRELILCIHVFSKSIQDKAGIGGLLHLHRFASLLTYSQPHVLYSSLFKSSDK